MSKISLEIMQKMIREVPKYRFFDLDNIFECVILTETESFFNYYIDEYLNQNKEAIYKKNEEGQNLLIFACEKLNKITANSEIINIILKYEPIINLQDKYGNTALHYACASECMFYSKAHILLDHGALITLKNNAGKNAFSVAVNNSNVDIDMIKLMFEHYKTETFGQDNDD